MKKSRRKRSQIWLISSDQLSAMVARATTLGDVLAELGLSRTSAGSYVYLKERLRQDGIDTVELSKRAEAKRIQGMVGKALLETVPLERMLTENSSYSRRNIKVRLIKEGLLPYQCAVCKNNGSWNGKSLALQLEHINGVNNDYRIKNLCLLCPNCHSQTSTWCSRNKKK